MRKHLTTIIILTITAVVFSWLIANNVHAACSNFSTCVTAAAEWGRDTGGLGTGSIYNFITRITTFIRGLLVSIATLAITIGGVMYMLSGGNEQRATRAKNIIIYAILGLIVGLIAWVITVVIQNITAGDPATAGKLVDAVIWQFINAISYFFISLAVLAIMVGGVMYILSGGDEKRSATAKNIVLYAILGLVIAGLALIIAQEVRNVVTGGDPVATQSLIDNVSNFVVRFIAVLSALVVIIGGIMYTMSLGDEQRSARAKRIVMFALAGLLISGLATVLSDIVRQIISPLLPTSDPFYLAGGPTGAGSTVAFVISSVGVFVLSPLAMIAAAAIIYGGYMYITSAGEEDKARLGKRVVMYTLIGIFIIMSAALLVNIILSIRGR